MMLLVVGGYYFLYMPRIIQSRLNLSPGVRVYTAYTTYLIFMLTTINNPFIYYYTSKDFRNALRKLVGLKDDDTKTKESTTE